MKTVYLLVKNGTKTYFNRAGVSFAPIRDGSVNFKLDMFPELTFQIRERSENEQEAHS
jgi:hypothetical protein